MRPPDETVGDPLAPHIRRWVIYRGRWFQIVLHQWLKSDPPVPHDHSWWNVSVRLRGRAIEFNKSEQHFHREAGWGEIHTGLPMRRVRFRRATDRHFVELVTPTMWTLFITGPHVREWGYWKRGQFISWRNYRGQTKT